MPRYIRNSVLRSRGQSPTTVLALRAKNRNLTATLERSRTASDQLAQTGAHGLLGLCAVLDVTGPVIENARERGTDSSGTLRKIDRIARDALEAGRGAILG